MKTRLLSFGAFVRWYSDLILSCSLENRDGTVALYAETGDYL